MGRYEQVEAASKAVRHELNEVEGLTEYSERGAAEICESVARAALAVLPEGSVDARKWAQAQLDIDTAHRERDSAWLAVEANCTDDYLISRLHQEMAKTKHHHEQEGILAERCEANADRVEHLTEALRVLANPKVEEWEASPYVKRMADFARKALNDLVRLFPSVLTYPEREASGWRGRCPKELEPEGIRCDGMIGHKGSHEAKNVQGIATMWSGFDDHLA